MKRTSLFISLLFLLFFHIHAQVSEVPKRDLIKQLSLPFLDSLTIVKDKKSFAEGKLIFESVTPLISTIPEKFHNFSTRQRFTICYPINEKQSAVLTPPIEIFNGGRIAIIYFIQDIEKNSYEFSPQFQFRSNIEKDNNGKSRLRQQLILAVENISNIMDIRFAFADIEIWEENTTLRQTDNDPPIGRRTLSISTEDGTFKNQYFYKNKEGIYSLMDFESGADYTKPEFIGGKTGEWNYLQEYMHYPEKARKNDIKGNVVVEFDLSEKGEISNPRIIAGSNPYLNQEAIRLALNSYGMWIPAQQNGINIAGTADLVIPFQPDLYPEEPENSLVTDILIYIAVFITILLISFLKEILRWINRKRYLRPNEHSFSVLNRKATNENLRLPNDNLIVITGMGKDDFFAYWEPENADCWIIEEIKTDVVMVKFREKPEIWDFLYLVYILNNPPVAEWNGKCIGWGTIPYMNADKPTGIATMVYTHVTEQDKNELFITTEENSYWHVNAKTYRYEETPTGEKYIPPPYPFNR